MTQTMIEYTGKSPRYLQASAAGGSVQEPVTGLKNVPLFIYCRNIT